MAGSEKEMLCNVCVAEGIYMEEPRASDGRERTEGVAGRGLVRSQLWGGFKRRADLRLAGIRDRRVCMERRLETLYVGTPEQNRPNGFTGSYMPCPGGHTQGETHRGCGYPLDRGALFSGG